MENVLRSLAPNQGAFMLIVVVVLLGFSELGLRTGLRLSRKRDEARKSQIIGVQGAVLGMLGLLLGFTFAMAVGRQDARRGMVLQEANAIGTTYLRADLLPPGHPEPVKELLRRYVDERLIARESSEVNKALFLEKLRTSAEIQQALWLHATDAAKQSPTPVVVSFVNALNYLIDTDAERVAVGLNYIPPTVWVLLVFVAAFGCFTSAYGSGAQGARSSFTSFFLPLLISVVISMIYDIDHSLQGVIGVSQQPMLELKARISE